MITSVVVLEDRAQVRRELKVKLSGGFERLRIEGVTPLVHDRSLVAKGCKVLDVRCVRKWLVGVQEREGEAKQLLEAEKTLGLERAQWERTRAALQEEYDQVEHALGLAMQGVQRELPRTVALPDALTKGVPALMEREQAVKKQLWDADRAINDCYKRILTVQARRNELQAPTQTLSAAIEIDVEGAGDVTLSVEYLVPCAAWRPMHRAHLGDTGVIVETDAAVWQATGEDWTDVSLQFSTARSTQRAEPPLLSDDIVKAREKATKDVVAHVRQQRIQTTGEGMSEPEVPGVDDGGETRLLGAAKKATIVSNGKMHRVPVLSFNAEASLERTARPELSTLVHLLSRQKNTSPQPMLAGPVELVRASGVVGQSTATFVAPGETFVLDWGADDALRIKRIAEEERDTARLTGKLTIERSVKLFLSNLSSLASDFQLEERIPVSELSQVSIVVDDKKTSPLKRPDDNGIIRWQVALPPHGTSTIDLHYTLVASSDVRGL